MEHRIRTPEARTIRSPEVLSDPAVIVEGVASRSQDAQFAPVRVLGYEPERIEFECDSPVDAVLVSSEGAYPGWKAALDGKEPPLLLVWDNRVEFLHVES